MPSGTGLLPARNQAKLFTQIMPLNTHKQPWEVGRIYGPCLLKMQSSWIEPPDNWKTVPEKDHRWHKVQPLPQVRLFTAFSPHHWAWDRVDTNLAPIS